MKEELTYGTQIKTINVCFTNEKELMYHTHERRVDVWYTHEKN